MYLKNTAYRIQNLPKKHYIGTLILKKSVAISLSLRTTKHLLVKVVYSKIIIVLGSSKFPE